MTTHFRGPAMAGDNESPAKAHWEKSKKVPVWVFQKNKAALTKKGKNKKEKRKTLSDANDWL